MDLAFGQMRCPRKSGDGILMVSTSILLDREGSGFVGIVDGMSPPLKYGHSEDPGIVDEC